MFKNAIAYSVVPGFRINPEFLERRPARECQALESSTDGFVAPCHHSTANLVHHVAGYSLICWQTEDKILPGSVVEEAVDEKVAEIERTQGRSVGRRERKELKEKVVDELLPRAFVQKRRTFGLHDRVRGYFVIDTSSPARAEKMLEALRRALDAMPAAELKTEKQPSVSMAAWILSGDPPYGLTINDDCVLEGLAEEKPTVRYARTDANADDVRRRVAAGYLPKKLAMTYKSKVSFVLSSEIHLARLTLLDIAKAAEQREQAEDAEAIFDGDVTMAAGEIGRLLDFLVEQFGGLLKPQEPDLLAGADVRAAARRLNDTLAADGTTATLSGPDGKIIATFGDAGDGYEEAKRAVVAEQRASISFVQRQLRIGYNAAARLIERMESDGIVSRIDGRGNREVLVKESAHA